ncbi:DUF3368 domain-containing protein [Roseimarinus sediminis]|uniref:DUF3368 domain-containing protein n=1 Tax=Roseimarinus sediminis TaxID=1610899 RepID=UPI003D259C65
MPNSSRTIISDTSCLIILSKINEFELLKKSANRILVTNTIAKEFKHPLPEWIKVREPAGRHYQKILELDVHAGEASAIALSLEIDNSILLIDDLKARKIAEKLSLKFSGTLGLILNAKQKGIIRSIKPILDIIKTTNFRFDHKLLDSILEEANE